jgi:threonyl-tRNA synthetase
MTPLLQTKVVNKDFLESPMQEPTAQPSANAIPVKLPDGSVRTVHSQAAQTGVTVFDVAKSISSGLAKNAIAGKINGKMADLTDAIQGNDLVEIIVAGTPAGIEIIRHSTAHIMAMAIQSLYPGTQVTIGPVLENTFYYDIKPPENVKIGVADFPLIETEMKKICDSQIAVVKKVFSREEAINHFKKLGETFKVELISDIPKDEPIKLYFIGDWADLCRGPHVPNTSKLGAFKLMSVSGAYWRADKNNPQLTRIYGTAWPTKKELDNYLHMLEEAKKRDHLVLGKQMGLFALFPEIAVGAPFFLPQGAKLFTLLQTYVRKKTKKYGYKEIMTPQIMNTELWKKSGHYDNYKENMYFIEVDEHEYSVKPMSCPAHVRMFNAGLRSYRELPLRYSEFGVVHRNELHGTVHGLTRVRRITQDDGHIFCTKEQISQEIEQTLKMVKECYSELGFEQVKFYLSTRPEKRVGDETLWDTAELSLENALKKENLEYEINVGDGAFYGPKIDINVRDAIGRWHQCATIQLDFQMPLRLGSTYISHENKEEIPVMIHRAVLGSIERFMGVYIEHCAGIFPAGLAPTQVRVLTISESQIETAKQLEQYLDTHGVRVETDLGNEKLSYKIREAQLQKIPFMAVIGEKEAAESKVTVRLQNGTNLPALSFEEFLHRIKIDSGVFWGLDINQV